MYLDIYNTLDPLSEKSERLTPDDVITIIKKHKKKSLKTEEEEFDDFEKYDDDEELIYGNEASGDACLKGGEAYEKKRSF